MVKNPSYFTLSRAARETGKSKSVIHKAIKDGQLSVMSKQNSGFQIDPAELFRVFPKNDKKTEQEHKKPAENDNQNEPYRTADYAVYQRVNTKEYTDVQVEVRVLRETLAMRDQTIQDLRGERDRWQQQAETLLLTHRNADEVRVEETDSMKTAQTLFHYVNDVLWWGFCLIAIGLGGFVLAREMTPLIEKWNVF